LLLFGLLLTATIPSFPRYGRFHLEAAVPLLGVLFGVTLARIVSIRQVASKWARVRIALGATLVGVSIFGGLVIWFGVQEITASTGASEVPYAGSITPLRAWVDSHAPANAPVAIYGL